MKALTLKAKNYRNIKEMSINTDPGINLICGDNAQGKTNLIEALWLFTGCKSFRGSRDSELVAFGEERANLEFEFYSEGREQSAEIIIDKKRSGTLNGIKMQSVREMIGVFSAVVFSPVHLSIVKGSPEERRKFIDMAVAQSKPLYAKSLAGYNKVLKQRNVLLKSLYSNPSLADTLDVWDERLASYGADIVVYRYEYTEHLKKEAVQIYEELSSSKEKFTFEYAPTIRNIIFDGDNISEEKADKGKIPFDEKGNPDYGEIKRRLYSNLVKHRKDDISAGTTSVGPHRDDFEIKVNSVSARSFGSQGQQRSCALALKLAEAEVLRKITDTSPVILLDDVMSELDPSRQDYILNRIKDKQVFITCCDLTPALNMCAGKVFEVKNGEVKEYIKK